MFIRGLTMTIAVWWAIETPLLAASLLDLRLVTDGSVDPPGDRLDVTVAFGPGEAQVRLQVQAMLVTGSDRSAVERVKARGEPNPNPAGFFQKSLTVSPRPDAPLGSASVVVPYAELALPPGTHLLAYEVQGYVGTALHFVRPTRLTQVRVSEQARTRLTLTSSRPEARPVRRQLDAYELRGEAASKRRVSLTTTKYVPAEQRTEQAVEIPGEFVRSEASVLSKDLGDSPEAWIPLEELRPKHERTVHFATTRRAAEAGGFGAEIGDAVQYGSCTVNVPVDNHRRGALELPPGVRNWWKQFDPAKFFYVYDTNMVSQEQFMQALSADDVVLYIHGFNTSFQHAVLTAAQLKHDLEFPGQVAAFSWPGDPAGSGLLGGYRLAEERVGAVPMRSQRFCKHCSRRVPAARPARGCTSSRTVSGTGFCWLRSIASWPSSASGGGRRCLVTSCWPPPTLTGRPLPPKRLFLSVARVASRTTTRRRISRCSCRNPCTTTGRPSGCVRSCTPTSTRSTPTTSTNSRWVSATAIFPHPIRCSPTCTCWS